MEGRNPLFFKEMKTMKELTPEQLEEVKKFAESLGFKVYIRPSGNYANFEVSLPSAIITVFYEFGMPIPDKYSVSIGWTSCDGGQASVAQTQDFIKFMGYAVQIAEKLKEA